MANFKMKGNELYDNHSHKVATLRGNDLIDDHSHKVGTIKGNDIYDDHSHKVLTVKGTDVLMACVAEDRTGGTEDTIKKYLALGKTNLILV